MKPFLLFLCFGLVCAQCCEVMAAPVAPTLPQIAAPEAKSVKALVKAIKQTLPKGWSVKYEPKTTLLTVARMKTVRMPAPENYLPNSPAFPAKPEAKPKDQQENFLFSFRCEPYLSPAQYHQFETENAVIDAELAKQYTQINEGHVTHKFDSFLPKTDAGKAQVARYEKLKATLHPLPVFYFQRVTLDWFFPNPSAIFGGPPPELYSIQILDETDRHECGRAMNAVLVLLACYGQKK